MNASDPLEVCPDCGFSYDPRFQAHPHHVAPPGPQTCVHHPWGCPTTFDRISRTVAWGVIIFAMIYFTAQVLRAVHW